MKRKYNNLDFLKSAFSPKGAFIQVDQAIRWLERKNQDVDVNVSRIPFSRLKKWHYDKQRESFVHDSGKFFSIEGIRIKTNWGKVVQWDQPIINQPEVGYLGIIAKELKGVLHFLMQAKIEPGNINCVQLSPTLQATRSNYTQVHKGRKPLYLEYFQKASPGQILLDQLQSEQGSRFLKKRNRNIIIRVKEDILVHDDFIWLTLAQIKKMMQKNSLVNMDTRTVVSGISFDCFGTTEKDFGNFCCDATLSGPLEKMFLKSAFCQDGAMHSLEEIIAFVTQMKSNFDISIEKISLKKVEDWIYGKTEIFHKDNKYFKVIAVDIKISNREVKEWTQPMVEPAQEGICAFVCKKIKGVIHFAVQAKLECGNLDVVELAPTVQCLTGNYRKTKKGALPFLDYVLKSPKNRIVFDALQSEEGGRFYREQNRNMIILAGSEVSVELPPNYIWMTLNQLHTFLKFNNYLNVQARSLIAAISFIRL